MTDTHGENARHDPKHDPKQHEPDAKHLADEQRKIDEKRRADAEKIAEDHRKAAREGEDKQREEERKADDNRREAAKKYLDAKRKEDDRRAKLSAPDRIAEDDKRAAMTPEERAKDDESKGLVKPDQFDQINLLSGTSQFPVLTEKAHTAEFILSEANGQMSRDNAYLADPVTIVPGQPLKQTVAPTSTTPGTYVPAAVGADCTAIAIYGGTSTPANGLRIAVLTRNAEVNGNLINWGAIITAEQAIGLTTLATKGIIARF
jgi:hypothetical protein